MHARVRVDDIFTDNPFPHLATSPAEILPAHRGSAAVISAERQPHHRPPSTDSPRCLQRWSLGRGPELMGPSFILPSGSKVTPVSAASKQGNGKLFTFTAAAWNPGGFFGG